MKFKALKGIQDIYPPDIFIWHTIETVSRDIFKNYGYHEIRLPIIESTNIFTRSIGETTDIVEKEMYTFTDKGGRSVTMSRNITIWALCSVTKGLRQEGRDNSTR
jgi:histidyl-tRNA synthetase